MNFWSTGTGENTLSLPLGDAVASTKDNLLIFKGKMGAPVFWEYNINLSDEDFISFFLLAKNPNTVEFMLNSPNRIRVFFSIAMSSVKFTLMTIPRLLKYMLMPKPKAVAK